MAVLPIYTYPHSVLTQKARRVREFNSSIQRLLDDMLETMLAANGVGLAANQVGVLLRAVVIKLPNQDPLFFLNPQILRFSGEREVEEGCLSYPGYFGIVKRSVEVEVKAQDRGGRPLRLKASELLAQVLEHEIDHLNGILFLQRLVPGTLRKIGVDALY